MNCWAATKHGRDALLRVHGMSIVEEGKVAKLPHPDARQRVPTTKYDSDILFQIEKLRI
jgi:hypothetical protein